MCHFKLVLLGDTAVGKSCLVVRFVRDEFFEYQEPTIGGERGREEGRKGLGRGGRKAVGSASRCRGEADACMPIACCVQAHAHTMMLFAVLYAP